MAYRWMEWLMDGGRTDGRTNGRTVKANFTAEAAARVETRPACYWSVGLHTLRTIGGGGGSGNGRRVEHGGTDGRKVVDGRRSGKLTPRACLRKCYHRSSYDSLTIACQCFAHLRSLHWYSLFSSVFLTDVIWRLEATVGGFALW